MMKTGKTIILVSAHSLAMFGADSPLMRAESALSWVVPKDVCATSPKPWLRQKKGRGAER